MACHLLGRGWSVDEVRARLGHTPNSDAINHYVAYLAIDRGRPKKKLFDSSLEEARNELAVAKRREQLTAERLHRQTEENRILREQVGQALDEIRQFKRTI